MFVSFEGLATVVGTNLRGRVDVVAATRAAVVEDEDLVAPRHERVDEM
jgi:hypothetical protein